MQDTFANAAETLLGDARKVCAAMPDLFGDPAPTVYASMHSTDDPNAVALYAAPANLSTEAEVTGLACRYTFDIQVYIRAQSSDEVVCLTRASHLANALLLIALADPRLGNTVDRVDASVGAWEFGTDNQKINTALIRLDYRCICVNQDTAAIKAILEADNDS